jgi:hypothetical protein
MGDVVVMGTADNTNDSGRGPSPVIWNDCDIQDFMQQAGKGNIVFDDFKNSAVLQEEAGRTAWTGGIGHIVGDLNLRGYTETALIADVALQADNDGVLMLDTDGTDDDVVGITGGDNVQGVFKSPEEGVRKQFYFEARVAVNTVTDGDLSVFVGIMEPGKLGDGTPLGAAGALADVDYIGFHITEANGDAVSVVYNEATSGTAQTDDAGVTLVAGTFVRLGFKVEILGLSMKVRFFVDGVDLGDDLAVDISSTDANWPGATDMDIMIAATSGANGADGDNVKIDWVRVAEQY